MAYIDDLTFVNALGMTDNDILYVGKPGDIDPDRRTTIAELVARIGSGLKINSGSLNMTLAASGSNPTVTYSDRSGRWSRVGDLVHIEFTITGSVSGGSGDVRIYGLPFAPRRIASMAGRLAGVTITAGRHPYYYTSDADSSIRIGTYASGGAAQVGIADFAGTSSVIISGTYTTSDS